MQERKETQVGSLSQEYPPKEEMATHSSILAGKIQWTEEPGGLQSMDLQKWDATEHAHVKLYYTYFSPFNSIFKSRF